VAAALRTDVRAGLNGGRGRAPALQRMAAPTAGVRRDGREQRIPTGEVVPCDVLLLAEGAAWRS
jgi:hypothetical protein